MQYRKDPKSGNRLSALGFGCMRLPRKHGAIDQEESTALIRKAIEDGVNYFDTAYMYAGNEETLGRALQGGLREKIYIADKMPPPLCRNAADFDKLLHKMLDRLGTDYIDYLLIHMLTDVETWNRLCGLGIEDWIRTQKQAGRIRSIGFSYHGGQEEFPKLLEAYNWDFCQIQYNYIDENNQAGRSGLQKAHERGLPVIIMEPLRGGRLVNDLPREAKRLIREAGYTPAELALRWLWAQPQVTCVLSGMNSTEMVKENLRIADEACVGALSPDQTALIECVKKEIAKSMKVGCTGCGYCMPCPNKVDIPMAFHAYNAKYTEGKRSGMKEYLQSTAMRGETTSASQCIGCGRCEKLCPQGIPIREMLREAVQELENLQYKTIKWAVKTFHIY